MHFVWCCSEKYNCSTLSLTFLSSPLDMYSGKAPCLTDVHSTMANLLEQSSEAIPQESLAVSQQWDTKCCTAYIFIYCKN